MLREPSPDVGPDVSREALTDGSRACAWCRGPIDGSARVDARTCSQRCRQAKARFAAESAAALEAAAPMRLAYADPPYPGLARRYYAGHPDFAGEVDHRALLSRLRPFDGWALSTSAAALPRVLELAGELGISVRVAAWFRGVRRVRARAPLVAWEPVVYAGGRRVVSLEQPPDALICHARPRTTDPGRVVGAKPARFAWWLFGLLGAAAGDELEDLFPGSGGIGRAWRMFQGRDGRWRAAQASIARGVDR